MNSSIAGRKFNDSRLMQVLLSPLISEKATLLGEKSNVASFRVMQDATKHEIRAAVQKLFKVDVLSVSVLNIKGKSKKRGKVTGKRSNLRKAYVTIKSGQIVQFGEVS